jgi:hypothetical protein
MAEQGRFFVHFFRGKFSPKNVGKKCNFPRKKFRKIIFSRNSAEFSVENHFPRKKMYEKSDSENFHPHFLVKKIGVFLNYQYYDQLFFKIKLCFKSKMPVFFAENWENRRKL